MQRLHVLLRPHERTIVHAAAGLSLLDLNQGNRAPHVTLRHREAVTASAAVWPCSLTRAGRLEGESCRQWPLWMRCRWTSSSADGSVQKWSAVLTLVYSNAHGPTAATENSSQFCARLFHICARARSEYLRETPVSGHPQGPSAWLLSHKTHCRKQMLRRFRAGLRHHMMSSLPLVAVPAENKHMPCWPIFNNK